MVNTDPCSAHRTGQRMQRVHGGTKGCRAPVAGVASGAWILVTVLLLLVTPALAAREGHRLTDTEYAASISGTVTYAGPGSAVTLLDMSMDPVCVELNGASPPRREVPVLGAGRRIANVLVQIKGGLPRTEHEPPGTVVEFDQSGCRFAPHVFALRVGQTLRVLNPDGTLHTVHAYSKVNVAFNDAMPKFRTVLERVFDQAEPTPFVVKCEVHPWMSAWVAVFDHPFYFVTGRDGSFRIGNLPAGTYELALWHERLPAQTHTVTVGARESVRVDAVMGVGR